MRVELQDSFLNKLEKIVEFIARDKPIAARRFKNDLIDELRKVGDFPFRCKPSIYFGDSSIRDMVFKGYTVVYKVYEQQEVLVVFGLIKQESGLDE
ncbi:MAG: type II toxin-antitoxin system RelE/ParE family toxin [Cryomorphaceae bacterium]|nr:MAG: type II toxin-antitoxin system RelE/ParE family toxin [Cryomorphaceae bacterium]